MLVRILLLILRDNKLIKMIDILKKRKETIIDFILYYCYVCVCAYVLSRWYIPLNNKTFLCRTSYVFYTLFNNLFNRSNFTIQNSRYIS
jgi:hypothetical protein